MAAYRRVYDLHPPQADCQEPGSAPEPCGRQSSTGYLYLCKQEQQEKQTCSSMQCMISGMLVLSSGTALIRVL